MITVRYEIPDDLAGIRRVNETAFGGSGEADLVDALRSRGGVVLSLVAAEGDEVVGHLLLSRVQIGSEVNDAFSAVGLGPVAVSPEHQRRGIGSQLINSALDACRRAGHDCMIVLGHAEYYPRFGFVPASRFGLRSEYNVPDEVFMAIELRDGALAGREGIVKYQPEFNEV